MLLLLLLLLLLLPLKGSQGRGYELKVSRSQMVQEGLCTYIPCTFHSPYSWVNYFAIYGYWFRKDPWNSEAILVATNDPKREVEKAAVGRFHLVGDVENKNCSLRITDIQTEDTGYYFFHMERSLEKHSYKNYQVKLDVKALTEKPAIYIPEILEPGHSVTLMCAAPWVCGNGIPPTFSWREAAVSSLGPNQRTPYFSELTLTPRPEDHGSNITCQMIFPGTGASTETTIQLSVAYPIKNFGISIDSEKERGLKFSLNHSVLKDESLRLLCQADSNPPAILSWSHGGRVVLSSYPSSTGILALQLPRLGVRDAGEYRCQAQYRMETQYATLNLSVICESCHFKGVGQLSLEGWDQQVFFPCVCNWGTGETGKWCLLSEGGNVWTWNQKTFLKIFTLFLPHCESLNKSFLFSELQYGQLWKGGGIEGLYIHSIPQRIDGWGRDLHCLFGYYHNC